MQFWVFNFLSIYVLPHLRLNVIQQNRSKNKYYDIKIESCKSVEKFWSYKHTDGEIYRDVTFSNARLNEFLHKNDVTKL